MFNEKVCVTFLFCFVAPAPSPRSVGTSRKSRKDVCHVFAYTRPACPLPPSKVVMFERLRKPRNLPTETESRPKDPILGLVYKKVSGGIHVADLNLKYSGGDDNFEPHSSSPHSL